MTLRSRSYDDVTVVSDRGCYLIRADGVPIYTPAHRLLAFPNAVVSEAVANEWRAQRGSFDVRSMPFTVLAFSAIDYIARDREAVIKRLVDLANSDVTCHRATGPDDLIAREEEAWDPFVSWAADVLKAKLTVTSGINHVSQSDDALEALTKVLSVESDLRLAGINAMASSACSLVIALAVAKEAFETDEAFLRANCDELYQAEKWGSDPQAQMRLGERAEEFLAAAEFVALLGSPLD